MQILLVCHLLPKAEKSQNWKEGLGCQLERLFGGWVNVYFLNPLCLTENPDFRNSRDFAKYLPRRKHCSRKVVTLLSVFKCLHSVEFMHLEKGYPWGGGTRRRRRIYVNPFLGRIQGIYICHGLKPTQELQNWNIEKDPVICAFVCLHFNYPLFSYVHDGSVYISLHLFKKKFLYKVTKSSIGWGPKGFKSPGDSYLKMEDLKMHVYWYQDANHSEPMRDIAKHISLTLFILTAMIIYSGEGVVQVLVCFIQTCTSPHAVFPQSD